MDVMLRNAWFLIRTLPFASQKAEKYLQSAADTFRRLDMPALLAWSLIDLGRLSAARKRPGQARAYLDEAKPLAELVQEPVLIERIDAVLAKLPET